MTDQQTAAGLQSRIDATRREYVSLRDGLEQRLGRHFTDAGDVADRLLSVVDEFGPQRALDLLAERPDDYGSRQGLEQGDWREAAAEYQDQLEALVDLHDRLDDLTREREGGVQRETPVSTRVVNIQGREYEFDMSRGHLREIESGERFPQQFDRAEEPRLTAVQKAMRDTKAGRARPETDRDRSRDR